jgi:hypothetical protein
MGIDQNVIATDVGVIRGNVANAAHVGGEIVDLIDSPARSQEAVLGLTQIQDFEVIAGRNFIFWVLNVNAADPMAVRFETLYQVVPNEAAGPRH